jgi:hypothetical protein
MTTGAPPPPKSNNQRPPMRAPPMHAPSRPAPLTHLHVCRLPCRDRRVGLPHRQLQHAVLLLHCIVQLQAAHGPPLLGHAPELVRRKILGDQCMDRAPSSLEQQVGREAKIGVEVREQVSWHPPMTCREQDVCVSMRERVHTRWEGGKGERGKGGGGAGGACVRVAVAASPRAAGYAAPAL